MNFLVLAAIILFVIAAGLLISILRYHPKTEAETVYGDLFPKIEEKDPLKDISYREVLEERKEYFLTKYPIMKVMTDIVILENGLLVFYKGSCRNTTQTVVFTSGMDESMHALCTMIERIVSDNSSVDYRFCIASSLDAHKQSFEKEMVEYMKTHAINVKGILFDGSYHECLKKNGYFTPLVGIENGTYLRMRVNGNTRRIIRFAEGFRNLSFTEQYSDPLKDFVRRSKDLIPWMIRLELKIMPKKGLRDLATYMPYTRKWMLPQLSLLNTSVVLKACCDEQFEDAFSKLNALAAENSVYLQKVEIVEASKGCYEKDWIAQRVMESVQLVFDREPVAIQVNDDGIMNFGISEYRSAQYMPVNKGRQFEVETAVAFYRNVLHG